MYDNTATGYNKQPASILTYNGSGWTTSATGQNVATTVTLKPGTGYIYRRAATAKPGTVVWSATPSYLGK